MYKKVDNGFFLLERFEDAIIKRYALITEVNFSRSEFDKLGLSLCLDMEDNGSVYWTFHEMEDIEYFFDLMNVNLPEELKGKVVETWWERKQAWGCKILGLTVNNRLIFKRRKQVNVKN